MLYFIITSNMHVYFFTIYLEISKINNLKKFKIITEKT